MLSDMAGHRPWHELRDRVYAENPGMRERVAVLKAAEVVAVAAAGGLPKQLTA